MGNFDSDGGSSSGELSEADQQQLRESQLFTQTFGICEAKLRDQGVDPDKYARDNVRAALESRTNREILLSKGTQNRLQYLNAGWAAFLGMFIGIGILALRLINGLKSIRPELTVAVLCDLGAVALLVAASLVHYKRSRSNDSESPRVS